MKRRKKIHRVTDKNNRNENKYYFIFSEHLHIIFTMNGMLNTDIVYRKQPKWENNSNTFTFISNFHFENSRAIEKSRKKKECKNV